MHVFKFASNFKLGNIHRHFRNQRLYSTRDFLLLESHNLAEALFQSRTIPGKMTSSLAWFAS
jgi:hypothetical protein